MNQSKSNGAWIGIDLGTTNCTAAVWDLNQSSPKVLRLKTLARPVDSGKGGKIVPSVLTFYDASGSSRDSCEGTSTTSETCDGLSSLVGYQALHCADKDDHIYHDACNKATITSFKRVVGMTSRQAKELQESDPDFWIALPFQCVILDHKQIDPDCVQVGSSSGQVLDVLGGASKSEKTDPKANAQEGVAISIRPLSHNPLSSSTSKQNELPEILVAPLQVTKILLQSIRNAADAYLAKNKKINPPSTHDSNASDDLNDSKLQNCIIGVPAHYSHTQRSAIQTAAKKAGFKGYVGVMTESTAAAMAYGLFVSPNVKCNDAEKRVLVFDMGGGTTDVTIAVIDGENYEEDVKFRVVATAGDRCLGGDNVDEMLARYLWTKMKSSSAAMTERWVATENHEIIRKCRIAKEQLCGNDKDDQVALSETHFTIDGARINVSQEEFGEVIQPLVDRAEAVVDEALSQMNSNDHSTPVHEVVLVGGSSHIPAIRDMLRRKFPPPIPPDLCTSISAETAVAQGLAIQSALVSGTVPLWELRNAMMLDALPHSIGVWVDPALSNDGKGAPYEKGDILHGSENKGHYVEILAKDSPLPSRGCATFTLANIAQFGVTVVAVEKIGEDTYQCMGTFTFLLHRLDLENHSAISDTRQIEVGMVLESNGKFIVSVFDDNDPEHRERKRKILQQKGFEEDEEYSGDDRVGFSGTEASLIVMCAIVFALYVATRIAFSDLELEMDTENDEL